MAKQSASEQLDKVISRLLGGPDAPLQRDEAVRPFDPSFSPAIEVIAALRDLPHPDFKARLKSELKRRAPMATTGKPVPEFRASATPYLSVRGAANAIEFYKNAFAAVETLRLMQPDGRIGHAEIDISGAKIYLADEFPEMGFRSPESLGGSPVQISLQVEDVDRMARRAIEAGATVVRPVADQFYGARSGHFRDPFGYTWVISTLTERLSPEEMQRRNDEVSRQQVPASEQSEPARQRVPYIRAGFHTVTPYLIIPDAAKWIDFVKQVFGAEEKFRAQQPGTETIMHAEVQIGDSMIELANANPQFPPMPMTLTIRADNPDAVYDRAIAAGAHPVEPVKDQPYGTRAGTVRDDSGNNLHIYTPLPGDKIFQQFRSVTPHLYADNAQELIDFLEKAFGGKEVYRAQLPDGSIPHAQVRIGDSVVAMAGSLGHGSYPAKPSTIHLYVPDTDATYEQAMRAGAASIQPPTDQPYGDRSCGVRDPFGNQWFIATHMRDVAP
ncbi:MAG: VOC family protein [Candidatus Acidiferrales bacterium]